MKPQFSWADTDVEPTAAKRAAAAIAIVGCFIDIEAVSSFLIAWCRYRRDLSSLLIYFVIIYIPTRCRFSPASPDHGGSSIRNGRDPGLCRSPTRYAGSRPAYDR